MFILIARRAVQWELSSLPYQSTCYWARGVSKLYSWPSEWFMDCPSWLKTLTVERNTELDGRTSWRGYVDRPEGDIAQPGMSIGTPSLRGRSRYVMSQCSSLAHAGTGEGPEAGLRTVDASREFPRRDAEVLRQVSRGASTCEDQKGEQTLRSFGSQRTLEGSRGLAPFFAVLVVCGASCPCGQSISTEEKGPNGQQCTGV